MTNKAKEYIKRYFEQQRELFGDCFWSARQELAAPAGGEAEPEPAETETLQRTPGSAAGIAVVREQEIQFQAAEDATLDAFFQRIRECQECGLGRLRTNLVFGVGNPDADLMFIGEAPGHDEDLKGEPFVGRAGQLLDRILAAIDLDRKQVYIGNILKCRPPQNRDPLPAEIACCEPYLVRQIELIKPLLIVALGRVAGQTLLRTPAPLRELRGKVHNYHGTDLVVTYHPAALLRNQNLKRPAWEDMQEIRRMYQEKRSMKRET